MGLDLRWPIGLMFSLIGIILTISGLVTGERSLGININLVWGIVLVLFGAFMLILAVKGSKKSGPPKS
ncbi:MAG: hypothetical protein ACTHKU_01060 [Verrucomicrobiota bacterium]